MPFWKGCNRNIDFIDQRHRGLTKVPDEVERYSRTLEELLLDSNQIRDLPKSLFRLEQLRKLTLSDNQLSRITADFASLVNLQELDVSKNDISQVTESIKHCKNLQVLDLSNNPLQDLPQSLTCLKNLTHLSLNDSSITRLPHDIGGLINLESLEMRENFLQQLPDSIGELQNLRILDMGNNNLDSVPESISQLLNLEELRMDCNDICEITSEIGNLKKLTELDLSENKLERLPQEIGCLVSITDFYLSQNQLDYLPDGIGNLKKLTTLKLDQNRLAQLTVSIGSCVSLQELILTENLLTDLPGSIGKLKNLSILMVDKNKLASIPPKIGGCSKLGVLSLRDNNIWKLPAELGFLKELHVLDVSGNRLQHLPMSLNSCNLKALWLSENQAQPLLKFQQDQDEETGDKVLTCFLLPQQAYTDSMENILRDTFASYNNDDNNRSSLNDNTKSFVKFADDAHEYDSDDDETIPLNGKSQQENHFIRHNTPHPKDLRVRHNKMFDKNVDGHMIPHKAGKAREQSNVNSEGVEFRDFNNRGEFSEQRTSISSHNNNNPQNDCQTSFSPVEETLSPRGNVSPLAPTQNSANPNNYDDDDDNPMVRQEFVLRVIRQPGIGLGISIAGGLGSVPYEDDDEGIFVSKVNPTGAAEKCGVWTGDKIISVNGKSMVAIEHATAVDILKSSGNDMVLVVSRRISCPKQAFIGLSGTAQLNNSTSLAPQSIQTVHQTLSPTSPSSPHSTLSSAHLPTPHWSHLQPSSSSSFLTNPHSLLSSLSSPPYQLPASLSSPSQLLASSPQDQPISMNLTNSSSPLFSKSADFKVSSPHDNSRIDRNTVEEEHNSANLKQPYPVEEIKIIKINSALGLSIVGGLGHTSLPFGAEDPGIFISKITKLGPASKTHLRVGDRLLAVNGVDVTRATHQEVVSSLVSSGETVDLLVRHDPPPPGMKEVILRREPGEALGLTIMGGEGGQEEGIFISKVSADSPACTTCALKPGQRILEVNGRTLLGVSQQEAIAVFASDKTDIFHILVCDGLDMPGATVQLFPPQSMSHSTQEPQSDPATTSPPLPFSMQNGLTSLYKIPACAYTSETASTTAVKPGAPNTASCIQRLDAIISEMNTLADKPFSTKPPVPKKPILKPSVLPPLPPVLQNLLLQSAAPKVNNFEMRNTSSSMDDLLNELPPGDERLGVQRISSLSLHRTDSLSSRTSRTSSEEQRRIRAEQRRQARLQFLEGTSVRMHKSLIETHGMANVKPLSTNEFNKC